MRAMRLRNTDAAGPRVCGRPRARVAALRRAAAVAAAVAAVWLAATQQVASAMDAGGRHEPLQTNANYSTNCHHRVGSEHALRHTREVWAAVDAIDDQAAQRGAGSTTTKFILFFGHPRSGHSIVGSVCQRIADHCTCTWAGASRWTWVWTGCHARVAAHTATARHRWPEPTARDGSARAMR